MFGDRLTVEEQEYWFCFNIIQKAHMLDVEVEAFTLGEVLELINQAEAKRRAKYEKGRNK
jgi:hypothetical protein